MKRALAALLLVLALGGAALSAPPRVGSAAPDFLLPAVQGPPVHLAQFRGRPLVLTFWAFWCDTWREVHRGLSDLSHEHGRWHFDLATVSIDCQWQEQIAPLLQQGGLPYRLWLDPESRVSRAWGVVAVPTVCVLDARGVVRARYEGWPGTRRLVEWLHVLGRPSPRSGGDRRQQDQHDEAGRREDEIAAHAELLLDGLGVEQRGAGDGLAPLVEQGLHRGLQRLVRRGGHRGGSLR